jgi:malate synthase
MSDRVEKAGLQVDAALAAFVESEVLVSLGKDAAAFWTGFANLLGRFVPINRALLAKRDDLQAQIDAWHVARAGKPIDQAEYQTFLREIGYLVPEPRRSRSAPRTSMQK